jgi:hypothetical protein
LTHSRLRRNLVLFGTLVIIVILGGVASGCGTKPALTATPTKTPVRAPAQLPDTPTPPPTSTPEPTVTPTVTLTPSPTNTPDPYARPVGLNPLTGLMVDDVARLERRPLMVTINNDPPARTQHYGFGQADVVYEYIMEGKAITRFTAVFLGVEAERIGPVRSARLVNLYLTPQYGGALVSSGAGKDLRWWLKNKMPAPYFDIDLDDPNNNHYVYTLGSDYMTRMQTSTARLRKWLTDKNLEQATHPSGFAFAQQPPKGASAKVIDVTFPGTPQWTYDEASGRYQRAEYKAPHIDAASGNPITVANVVLQVVKHEETDWQEDVNGVMSIRIIPVGDGRATVIRDGVAITGTWKAGDTTNAEFRDSAGALIPLKPGNTWFELLEPTDKPQIH